MELIRKPKNSQKSLFFYLEQKFLPISFLDKTNNSIPVSSSKILFKNESFKEDSKESILEIKKDPNESNFEGFSKFYQSMSLTKLHQKARLYQFERRSKLTREAIVQKLHLYESAQLNDAEWIAFLGNGWAKREGAIGFQNENKTLLIAFARDFYSDFVSSGEWTNFQEIMNASQRILHPDLQDIIQVSKDLKALTINKIWYSLSLLSKALSYLFPREGLKCYQHEVSGILFIKTNKKGALLCPIAQ
jgi:hypothetical protein